VSDDLKTQTEADRGCSCNEHRRSRSNQSCKRQENWVTV